MRYVHGVWLQRKDEVSYERYKEKRKQAKRTVHVAKVHADERWCRKVSKNFHDDKIFWKEVHKIRKGTTGN